MSFRILQINDLIQKELAQAILQEIELPDALATITKVETAQDLSCARVWISILPEDKRKQVINTLQKNKVKLQSVLNARLRLKKIPKLRFLIDTTEEKAERINKLLDQITDH